MPQTHTYKGMLDKNGFELSIPLSEARKKGNMVERS